MAGAGFNNAFYRAGVNLVGDLPGGPRGKMRSRVAGKGGCPGEKGLFFKETIA